MKFRIIFLLLLLTTLVSAQDTFSIVAVDPNTGEIGSAGASCLDNISFPGSGGAIIISDIIPGRGAIHTQSYWNATNQANARAKMLEGLSPDEVLLWVRQNDAEGLFNQIKRQYGAVDFDPQGQPRAAAYTGTGCFDWKGHRIGANYAIQGNILLGPQVLDSMEARFLATEGQPLAIRLMAALQGANMVGADTRCTNNGTSSLSAFIRMAQPGDTLGNFHLDLNVPSLPAGQEPIDSLQTLFDAWVAVNTISPNTESLLLFPNPTSGSGFTVEIATDQSGVLKIFTLQGILKSQYVLQNGPNTIPDPELPGIYVLVADLMDGRRMVGKLHRQ